MKVIYIAGPFRGANSWEQELNVRRAEGLALDVWRAGAAAICPHANTRFFQGVLPDDVWLEGDMEMVKRCDAVLLVPGWQWSKGALDEFNTAIWLDIPVYDSLEKLKSWIERESRGDHEKNSKKA